MKVSFHSTHARLSAAALTALLLTGCSPKEHELVVATVGDDKITAPEYGKMYTKSNNGSPGDSTVTRADREKFLDLLVKYRLKLKDAQQENLGKDPEVIREVDQYKGSLAQSFLTEREIIRPGVRRLYERRTEEIRVAHILLELQPTAGPEDSARQYALAATIIAQLKAGKDFGDLAEQYSKDPSVKSNRGDLYYASGGDFVEPFETVAYGLKPGEISSVPVRTQYGLHIIKVTDRHPNPGQIRASHIMIRFPEMNPKPEDTLAALAKIRKIQDSLAMGIDFANLARRNSQDGGSAQNGGDLGFFARRRWVRPFDDTVMTMHPGQISSIVRTSFGYHLIKCTDRKPVLPFDQARGEIEQLYQQRRFQDDNAEYLKKLRAELRYTRSEPVVRQFIATLDSTKAPRDTVWNAGVPASLRKETMMTILGRPVTVDSFMTVFASRPDMSTQLVNAVNMYTAVDKVSEQMLYGAKANLLLKESQDFQGILNEYTEGILLYQIEQNRVWSRIAPNDSLLRLYFAQHRDKFNYPDRVRISELRFTTDAAAAAGRTQLQAGASFGQLVGQDSARMALPSNFVVSFARGSTTLSRAAKKALDSVAAQWKDDPLSLRITASPDTLTSKEKNLKQAQARIAAVKTYLTRMHGVKEDMIIANPAPQPSDNATPALRKQRGDVLGVAVIGRQPRVIGTVNLLVLDPATDDRARKADSLKEGEVAVPFFFKNGYCLIRLEGRAPARPKTYEEAGPEVSTAYQDYEAKRLEDEWVASLKKRYPVVEHKDVLQSAFAPGK